MFLVFVEQKYIGRVSRKRNAGINYFKCSSCYKMFKSIQTRALHIIQNHECTLCGKLLKDK